MTQENSEQAWDYKAMRQRVEDRLNAQPAAAAPAGECCCVKEQHQHYGMWDGTRKAGELCAMCPQHNDLGERLHLAVEHIIEVESALAAEREARDELHEALCRWQDDYEAELTKRQAAERRLRAHNTERQAQRNRAEAAERELAALRAKAALADEHRVAIEKRERGALARFIARYDALDTPQEAQDGD